MKKTYGVLSIQKQNRNDGTKIPRKSDISPPKKSGGAHACMYDVYMGTHLARVWIPSPARGQLKREESEPLANPVPVKRTQERDNRLL